MLQPGREGGTVHYQQFFGSICPSQTLTQDEFQASTAYGPEIWYSVAYTACWPPQACEPGDRTGLEERNSARLAHMLLPTGNPSDLPGKLQGENITVTSEPYFVEKSMQLRKQIWIGQIFLAMKKITQNYPIFLCLSHRVSCEHEFNGG